MAQVINPGRGEKTTALDAMVRALQGYQAFTGARENSARQDHLEQQTVNAKEQPYIDFIGKGGRISEGPVDDTSFETTHNVTGSKIYLTPPTNKAELLTPYQAESLKLEREKLSQSKEKAQTEARKEKQPTQGQFTAGQFGKRVEQANTIFDSLEQEGYNRSGSAEGLKTYLPNVLKPTQLQEQEQAERNFVNAVLRRESGAAIAPSEFKSAEIQYFPRAGDTPEVLDQKKQNREQAFAGLKAESGPAWEKIPSATLVRRKERQPSGEAFADSGPKVGTEKGGYVFQGGDPADQKSWKKK